MSAAHKPEKISEKLTFKPVRRRAWFLALIAFLFFTGSVGMFWITTDTAAPDYPKNRVIGIVGMLGSGSFLLYSIVMLFGLIPKLSISRDGVSLLSWKRNAFFSWEDLGPFYRDWEMGARFACAYTEKNQSLLKAYGRKEVKTDFILSEEAALKTARTLRFRKWRPIGLLSLALLLVVLFVNW
ncbi:MAG: hypothetical protein ABJN40_10510 [Sneathiella sp.]